MSRVTSSLLIFAHEDLTKMVCGVSLWLASTAAAFASARCLLVVKTGPERLALTMIRSQQMAPPPAHKERQQGQRECK